MKTFIIHLLLLLTTTLSFAQSSRQAKIDSLESIRSDLTRKLVIVEAELVNLKKVQELENADTTVIVPPFPYIVVKIEKPFSLRDDSGNKVEVVRGDSLELLSFEGIHFQVRFNGKDYRVWKFDVYSNWIATTGLTLEECESKWDAWYAPIRPQIEKKKRLVELRKAEEKKRIAEVKAAERKKSLIKRFGKRNAERILNREIWLGMTALMALESLGSPMANNRTVGSFGVHEQWVYERNRYLYFENDVLVSWQD